MRQTGDLQLYKIILTRQSQGSTGRPELFTKNKGGPWKMADDGAMVVYRGVDNQSEEMIHQGDRRSDKSVTVAGLT